MPWEHCGQEILDDDDCPDCGISKAAWTIEWNRTRTFQLGARTKKPFLRLELVDEEDDPVIGEPFRAVLPGGEVHEGELDEYGTAKVPVPSAGRARLSFPERSAAGMVSLGHALCERVRAGAAEPVPAPAPAPPVPAAPSPPPPPAGVQHVVAPGESLARIAQQHGIANWREIYDHPRNAAFRELRPNPNLIHPGDELFVPTGKGASEPAPAPEPAQAPAEPAPPPPPLQPDEACFRCEVHPTHRHRFRLLPPGQSAWSRRRAHFGARVRLGYLPEEEAPAQVSFAVFAEGMGRDEPVAEVPATREGERFLGESRADWLKPGPQGERMLRFHFEARDGAGKPVGVSHELRVLAQRVIQV